MSRLDFFRAREIGDGAADFEDQAVGAGAQAQLVDGRFEQLLRVVVHGTITFDISGAHLRVGVDVSFLETLQLNRTRIIDPLANDLRRFAGVATSEILSKEFIEEIKIGKKILKSFRRILRRARITWIEGNHEFRLRKYLIKNAKELYGLPGLSVPALFGLKDLKIEYVPCHSMASKFTDNFIRVGNLYVGHWDTVASEGGYAAKRIGGRQRSEPSSRTHTAVWRTRAHHRRRPGNSRNRKLFHVREKSELASYPNWQQGFSVIYLEPNFREISVVSGRDNKGNVYLEGTKILNAPRACLRGSLQPERKKSERWHGVQSVTGLRTKRTLHQR